MKIKFNSDGHMKSSSSSLIDETDVEKEAYQFEDTLELVDIRFQTNGAAFKLKDSNGKYLYMSHSEFSKMIEKKEIKVTGTFGFTKHGTKQSITSIN